MGEYKVRYRGAKGEALSLEESTSLIAIRTKQRRLVSAAGFANPENQNINECRRVFSLEEQGMEVLDARNKTKRDSFRKSLNEEGTIEFAGRALRMPNTEIPVLYTENLFVKFDGRLSEYECRKRIEANGLEVKRPLAFAPNAYFVAAPAGTGLRTFEIPDELFKDTRVELCHPELVFPRQYRSMAPQQWHLGRTTIGDQTVEQHANVVKAWSMSVGRDVVIAIIDDGVAVEHEEFSSTGKIVAPQDTTRDTNSADPGPGDNHGTACAGVACANGNHGASGVAPRAKLMPIRLASGLGTIDEAEAFYHAAQNGADIISCSWGPPDGRWWEPSDPLHNRVWPLPDSSRLAIDYAVQHGRAGKGCVITWAAGNGNESSDNDGWASYEKVINVAACNDMGARSAYSDYGQSIWCCFPSSNGEPSLTPGIWTTDRPGFAGYNRGNPDTGDAAGKYTNSFGGTSSACPGVAGVAALILSVNPSLRWDQVKDIIKETCDPIDTTNGNYNSNGHSVLYGYGRVNASRAVAQAISLGGQARPQEDLVAFALAEGTERRGDPCGCSETVRLALDHFGAQNKILARLLESARGTEASKSAISARSPQAPAQVCDISRPLISLIVRTVVYNRTIPRTEVTESTSFGFPGLDWDREKKRGLFIPIDNSMSMETGCRIRGIGPEHFAAAKTVGDIVNTVAEHIA